MIRELLGLRQTVPLILQSERAECGLACVAMVSTYHGHDVDLPTLRQRFAVSAMGATLRDLINIGNQLSLSARAIKAPMTALRKLTLPLILHWDFNHFVVLTQVRADGSLVIHDPGEGQRVHTAEGASTHYTGVALELLPGPSFARVKERSALPFRVLLRGALADRRPVWHGVLFAVVAQCLALSVPIASQFLIDTVAPTGDLRDVHVVGAALVLVALTLFAAHFARGLTFVFIGAAVHGRLSRDLFRHLMALPLDFFQRRQVSDLVSRFDSLRVIQRILGVSFIEAVVDGFALAVTLLAVAVYSLPLAVIGAGLMVLYAALRWAMQASYVRHNEEQIVNGAKVQTSFIETMRGVESIKANNGQSLRTGTWESLLVAWLNSSNRLQGRVALFSSSAALLQTLTFGLCLWYSAAAVVAGKLSVGVVLASLSLLQLFSIRFVALVDKLADFGMLAIHRARLSDVYAAQPEGSMEGHGLPRQHAIQGELVLSDISFRYRGNSGWVLRHLDLRVAPGEYIAIAGPSGEGKSTLLRIMLGLLEPEIGKVVIDGQDLQSLGKQLYRDAVGVVLQEDTLFSGSILENIVSFDPIPDMARVEHSARLAGIHDTIVAFPMGYRTLVGDMGSVLSGGQQQRIFLARALYRQPRILFLDEATSHLDVAREQEINVEISKLGITRVVIAHRPETLKAAQRVLHLVDGQLHESTYTKESVKA